MFDDFIRARALANNTARSYKHSFETLGVNPQSTRDELIAALDGLPGQGVKITALKSYYGWLVETGQRLDNPTVGLKLPRVTPSLEKGLSTEQYTALKESLEGEREVALVGLLFGSGLRANEVIALDWQDVEDGEVLIREAKHGSVGRVPINATTADALKALRRSDGPVFVSESNRSKGQRLSYTGLRKMIKEMGQRIGLELTCHDGRHTFVQMLVDNDVDMYLAAALTRHKDLRSLAPYADKVKYRNAVRVFRTL
jgi:integrase/recombinase XerD